MEESKNFSDEGENEDQAPEDPEVLGHSLIKSSANGDLPDVLSLLKRKADPNFTDKKNWTALMWASSQGHTEIVKVLLEKNGKILMESGDKPTSQHTPLHWSSFNGHLHVVWALLKQGFNPNDIIFDPNILTVTFKHLESSLLFLFWVLKWFTYKQLMPALTLQPQFG